MKDTVNNGMLMSVMTIFIELEERFQTFFETVNCPEAGVMEIQRLFRCRRKTPIDMPDRQYVPCGMP